MFKARRVGPNEIYGSICAYILIGMVFGFFYLLIEAAAPGSFRFTSGQSSTDVFPFLVFSFSALAGGSSDVMAAAPFARSLALIEILIGVIYGAVLIGRLISAQVSPKDEGDLEAAEKHREERILHELLRAEEPLKKRPVGLIIAAVMFNFTASALMIQFQLPFFLDSWGTSLAVLLGGSGPGLPPPFFIIC